MVIRWVVIKDLTVEGTGWWKVDGGRKDGVVFLVGALQERLT